MEWETPASFSQNELSHLQPGCHHDLFGHQKAPGLASQLPSYQHSSAPQPFQGHLGYASQTIMNSYDPDDRLSLTSAAPSLEPPLARIQSSCPHLPDRRCSSQPSGPPPVTMLAQRFTPQTQMPGFGPRTTASYEWVRNDHHDNGRFRAGSIPHSHQFQNHPERWVRDYSRPPAVPLRQQVTLTSRQPVLAGEKYQTIPKPITAPESMTMSRSNAGVVDSVAAMSQPDNYVEALDVGAGSYTRLLNAAIPPRSLPFGLAKKTRPSQGSPRAAESQATEESSENKISPRGKQTKQTTVKKKAGTKARDPARSVTDKQSEDVHKTTNQQGLPGLSKAIPEVSEINNVKDNKRKRTSTATKTTRTPPAKRMKGKLQQHSSEDASNEKEAAAPVNSPTETGMGVPSAVAEIPAAKAPIRQRKRTVKAAEGDSLIALLPVARNTTAPLQRQPVSATRPRSPRKRQPTKRTKSAATASSATILPTVSPTAPASVSSPVTAGSQDEPSKAKSRQRAARKPRVLNSKASESVPETSGASSTAQNMIQKNSADVHETNISTVQLISPVVPCPSKPIQDVPRSNTPELVSLLGDVESVASLDPSNEPSLLNAMMGLQQVETILQGRLQPGDLQRLTSPTGCQYLLSYQV